MGRFSEAMHQLQGSQKTSRGVSLYSRFVNRPGGRVLAAAASTTSLSPNQVSLLSGLVTMTGLVLLAVVEPSILLGVVVWVVLVVGFMLDSADGQLARLRGQGSPAGEWLDHTLDAAKMVGLHAAVLISWYRFFDLTDDRLLLVPLLYQLVAVVMFVGGTLAESALRGRGAKTSTAPSTKRSVLLLAGDYGILCLVFLLLGWQSLFVAGYSLLAAANALLLLALLMKWFRELSALSKPTGARAQ